MSGRRWGIGLVTALGAVTVALASIMATIVLLYELCDAGQHGSGSTADTLCGETSGTVVFLAYLSLPALTVIAAGIAGIKAQRWRTLWIGLGLAVVILVAGGLVIGNVSTTAA